VRVGGGVDVVVVIMHVDISTSLWGSNLSRVNSRMC
jgi:hypothetical protein